MNKINELQIQKLFMSLEEMNDTSTKIHIFENLGENCYECRNLDKWIEKFGNIQEMISWISTNESPYWEKLEFSEDKKRLYLTGKEVQSCACAYNNDKIQMKSLCNYCCKKFQETLWGDLLKKKVSVEITESIILGGKRCNTVIHIL
jgi:hypothetical protein